MWLCGLEIKPNKSSVTRNLCVVVARHCVDNDLRPQNPNSSLFFLSISAPVWEDVINVMLFSV